MKVSETYDILTSDGDVLYSSRIQHGEECTETVLERLRQHHAIQSGRIVRLGKHEMYLLTWSGWMELTDI